MSHPLALFRRCSNPLSRARARAFTLIELLVVIVVLGILMAVAVPTFLRQQTKAQDSRTQQYLTTAYKAIRASTPETNNAYPISTSMVSWIRQSEPELSAQSGNCVTGVATAPVDQVLVDPASNANALIICAKSQSGNVWKLSASATSAATLADGTVLPLTETGPVINDAFRAQGTQGDGLASDSSSGVWQPSTNMLVNGGFETDTSDWAAGGGTITRDPSVAKFGVASLHVSNPAIPQVAEVTRQTVTPGTAYTASVWVRGTGTAYLTIDEADSSNVHVAYYNSTVTSLSTSWQRLTVTRTPAAGNTNAHVIVTGSSGGDLYVDGVQYEQRVLATPYIETNGGTASRTGARIQIPTNVLNPNTGWAAFRVRMGFASSQAAAVSNAQGVSLRLLDWENDSNNRLLVVLNQGSPNFSVYRQTTGTDPAAGTGAQTWNTGDTLTVITKWDASNVYISFNGGPFSQTANSAIPALSVAKADIGSIGGAGNFFDGAFLWAAFGTGVLSDADAATANSWGNADPKRSSFAASAQATMVWDGTSTNGSLK